MNTVLRSVMIIAAVSFYGCGGGRGGSTTPGVTSTFSIAGAVTGATGVKVNLTGVAAATTTTDTSGNYSFVGLANGDYTVTPAKTGYAFSPINSTVNVSGANVTGKNFIATVSAATAVTNAVAFTGSNLDTPDAIAVDASGSVWVGNWNLTGVTRIQPSTATANCSTGCTSFKSITSGIYGGLTFNILSLAVDASDNVWIPDGILMEISSALSVKEVVPSSLSDTHSVGSHAAIDNNGNIWTVGVGFVDKTNSVGIELAKYPLANNLIGLGIAIDAANSVWISAYPAAMIKYPAGSSAAVTYSGGGLTAPSDIAVDGAGNVWVVNFGAGASSITEIQKGAPQNCSSGCVNFTNSALTEAEGVAIDGANNVWIAGGLRANVVKIAPGATSDCSIGCTFYTSPFLSQPTRLAIDATGNLWIADRGANSIVKIPALAATTTTPIVKQVR